MLALSPEHALMETRKQCSSCMHAQMHHVQSVSIPCERKPAQKWFCTPGQSQSSITIDVGDRCLLMGKTARLKGGGILFRSSSFT